MPFLHIAKGLPSFLPSLSPYVNFQPIGANFQQKVAKVNFFLLALVFSRDFRRQKRAKTKYILKVGAGGAVLVVGVCLLSSCPLVQACRLSRVQDLQEVGSGPLVVCFLLLSAFLLCPLADCLQICPYFAFLGGFGVVSECWRGFVLAWCFAWLVWLLCA